jgi:dipeptidyl aminopeptidase/acylaminoacyl peptidase
VAVVILLAWHDPGAAGSPDGTILLREKVELPADTSQAARKASQGVVLERVVYASDGLEVEGFLARPAEDPASPVPCVIFNRGGNRDFGALDPTRATYLLGRIARRGYVAIASNYRGNGKFGGEKYPGDRICPECKERIGGRGREEFGGAEVNDVLALIPVLGQVPQADTTRMAVYGWSRGGMMTYLTLKASDRFKAAIVGAGMADLAASVAQRSETDHVFSDLIPGWDDPAIREKASLARSAVRWADQLPGTTPILILQGTGDWRVDPTQAIEMARALLTARRPFRLVMLEGGDHGLSEYREEVDRLVGEWLDRYVRDGASWPSLEPHGK